ncbi:hypothetical protein Q4S45_11650 [Massilia sp. R2A-15]|uniref:hypothetical protein n=1 Tax=Massilia sp. R2A-15 TaxID=3064278 RepID=UPI0027341E6B|nr:hypothetical protein [Massilia sp. R2A-15]WLI87402.1 hypothetical protein Q4S45_11650 [Massilia sp. R2A-15]
MTYRHFASRAIGIAVLGALTWSPLARPAGQPRTASNAEPPARVALKDGGRVEFCADGAACRSGKHPDAVGTVRQIVPGDFVSAAPASWIALSDRSVNVCYLAAAAASVTCTPVANSAELTKGTQIEYLDLDDGTRTFRFSPKQGDRASWKASYDPYPFMSGISAAAEVLQKHAARRRNGNATYANTALGGGGDVCAFIDGGGITCTSTDGEAVRDDTYNGGNRVSAAAPVAASARQTDQYAINTVETGRSERPTLQNCTAAANRQMNDCNNPRNNLGYEAHRACMADAESNLQECKAEVRYNANLNR